MYCPSEKHFLLAGPPTQSEPICGATAEAGKGDVLPILCMQETSSWQNLSRTHLSRAKSSLKLVLTWDSLLEV